MLKKPYPPSSLVSRMASMDITLISYLRDKVMKKVPYILSAITEKAKMLTDEDRETYAQYLSINAFPTLEKDEQLACYSMVIEAEHIRCLNKRIKIDQKYTGLEPVFRNKRLSESIVHDGDLIDYKAINRIPNTNIAYLGKDDGYCRIDSRIPMCFYHWLEDCYKNCSKSVHIDPFGTFSQMPTQMLVECVIQPPKRDWWSNLNIYNGESKGCSIILLGNDVKNRQDYEDYNILGIRKLQVSVARQNNNQRNAGNMQMMIEELTKIYESDDPAKAYMIGRMIHLDTDAKTGTSFKTAVLNHIDLAENLYVGDDAYFRDGQDLARDHSIQDATHRTHLLRVDNVPFESVFKFAYAFFKSKQLVDEWKENEFI